MTSLFVVSIIWAFSFSLIGQFIVGKMDTYIAIFIRFIFALAIFLPFIKWKNFFSRSNFILSLIGALQIGVMYIFYFNSFRFLTVVEVSLFTVVTPLYISLLGSFFTKSFKLFQLLNILLVIVGAAIVKWNNISGDFVFGFLLVQGANLSFALGQVLYKRMSPSKNQREVFGFFYLGALFPISILVLIYSSFEFHSISFLQWGVLLWLGLIASGVGYFIWNKSSKLVSFGELAVMNNIVIPLAIIVNIVFWQTKVEWGSFFLGSLILCLGVYLEKSKKFH